MANTYSQIYIQVVFAVQGRQNLIQKQNKEELHKFMTGIVREREQKLLAVHCMPDHTHILIGLKPAVALSDVVRDLKNGSTNFINRNAGCWAAFAGRKVSALSPTAIPSLRASSITFAIRNDTMRAGVFATSTSGFSRSTKSSTMSGTSSSRWIEVGKPRQG